MTNTTADMTMFDQAVAATYRTEGGTTEQVAMIGSDLSRRTYPTNMVLIVRTDGSRRLTSEAWLSQAATR
jgi:hypothetical protein